MFESENLDELSALLAKALFSRYPEWERYAKRVKCWGFDAEALEISVPAPGTNHSLQLTTDGEITVAFGPWHVHCTPFSDVEDTFDKAVAQAMRMIDRIVTEQVAFIHESGPFASHVQPSKLSALLTPSTIQVYSWLGTYDRLTPHRQI